MDDKFYLAMVDKFNASNIAELDFNDGSTRFVLRKNNAAASDSASIPAAAASTSTEQPVRLGISSGSGEKIESPIVGTFYAAPSPDAPPFVKIGSKVKAGETLCILEAMKMMNHLEAEFDCEILEIHASSGDLVEFGQEIFTIKRT